MIFWKKAQTGAVFVIGVMLLFSLFLLLSLDKSANPKTSNLNTPLYDGIEYSPSGAGKYVERCLNRSASASLLMIGKRGGLMELSDPYLPTAKTSILLSNNADLTPTIENVQSDLGHAINMQMDACIGGFDTFTTHGIEIDLTGEATTRAIINEDNVEIYHIRPFSASNNKESLDYQNFKITIPLKLGSQIETAAKIIKTRKTKGQDGDLNELLDNGLENIFFTSDGATIAVIRDLDNKLDGAPYEFWVGMK